MTTTVFKVTPITKYTCARYPIIEEYTKIKNDFSNSGVLLRLAAGPILLIPFTLSGCSNEASSDLTGKPVISANEKAPQKSETAIVTNTSENPFTWEASGLPIRWVPYGTGAPATLSEENARPVIEEVFAKAGINLQKDVIFERDGIKCELDGYDKTRHIGFEFVGYADIEDVDGIVPPKEIPQSEKRLSHNEIKNIMKLQEDGKEHIVIISCDDSRFSYFSAYSSLTQKEYADQWKKIIEVEDPAERAMLEKKLLHSESHEIKQPATVLRKLEENLNEYLRWLKSQGSL